MTITIQPDRGLVTLLATVALITLLAGCSNSKTETMVEAERDRPDYSRPLPPGQSALRLITDPRKYPDLGQAFRERDVFLIEAMDQSLTWFDAPSSRRFFPFESITHEQARASVLAMRDLIESARDETEFVSEAMRLFDVYESVGYNGEGTVLFTGYYSPTFTASEYPTSQFSAPLYNRPADLATDPLTGTPLGRQLPGGGTAPYFTRRQIETNKMFTGSELVWLESPLDAYIIHVNGSAKLRMPDGTTKYVGYAGKTDRPYTGLGAQMLEAGMVDEDELSLKTIRRAYKRDPNQVADLMLNNENYVFFTEYDGGNWPAGSLGVRVTQETSLATDKKIYPRGGVVLVDTQAVRYSGGKRDFLRFMMDQDTGGAIQAPGRADIFMGIGPSAEILAGGQYAEGRLYYFFLKPRYVQPTMAGVNEG